MKRIVAGILVAVMVLGAAYGAAAAVPTSGVDNLDSTIGDVTFSNFDLNGVPQDCTVTGLNSCSVS